MAELTFLPGIIVEAGFAPAAPGLAGTSLILDDAANGKLDTGTLGPGTAWTSLGGYIGDTPIVQSLTITRSSTRQQGPLVTYEAATCTITLANSDGRFSPENLAGPYVAAGVTQVRPMVPLRVRASWNGITYDLFSGYVRSWTPPTAQLGPDYDYTVAEAQDAFCVLAGVTIPGASAAGAGELSGARVTRILNAAGWYAIAQGLSDVDAGQSAVQGTTFGGTALELLQLTADSEIGDLYISGKGQVTFRDRHAPLTETRSNTVQALFGDWPGTVHPAGTELAYAEISRPDDDTMMANDVQATINGSSNMQEAKDAASIARFLFPRSYSRSDLILQTDTDALNWASYVLAIAKGDESRFDSMTLQASAHPDDLFPQVLGRELGDRIQVWRRPPGVITGTPWSLTNNFGSAPANNFTIPTTSVPQLTIGDRFQIYASGVLKEATTFTVTVIGGDFFGNTAITFTPAAASVLAVGDVVTQTGGTVIKDCFIRSVTHTVTLDDGWVTEWGLQNAGRYSFFVLDNATLGQLGSSALAF